MELLLKSSLIFLLCSLGYSEPCWYQTSSGQLKKVNSINQVPAAFKKSAKCGSLETTELVSPEKVSLEGNVREEDVFTSLGKVHLRWVRSSESLFGKTPSRSIIDAAKTVSRALRNPGFPDSLRKLKLDWKVVFIDDQLPESEIPTYLVNNCHPAWMTPPSNIYVVSQRVSEGCGGFKKSTRDTDAELAAILTHEIAHALEFQLLGQKQSARMTAEGFATWFAEYASEYSSIIDDKKMKNENMEMAKYAVLRDKNFNFSGSGEDYARASRYFKIIADRYGINDLIKIYDRLAEGDENFFAAVKFVIGEDQKGLDQMVYDDLDKNK